MVFAKQVVAYGIPILVGAGYFLDQAGEGGTATLRYWQAPTILNPYLSRGTKEAEGASLVIEPLAEYNPNGELVPVLAELWSGSGMVRLPAGRSATSGRIRRARHRPTTMNASSRTSISPTRFSMAPESSTPTETACGSATGSRSRSCSRRRRYSIIPLVHRGYVSAYSNKIEGVRVNA